MFIALLALIAVSSSISRAEAAIPGDLTLGLNIGYPLGLELELEYKYEMVAGGFYSGLFMHDLDKMIDEWHTEWEAIGLFGRFYMPIGKGFDFYLGFSTSIMAINCGLFPDWQYTWIVKVGPGFDYRWEHLRLGLEGGFLYSLEPNFKSFYVKAGVGLIFW